MENRPLLGQAHLPRRAMEKAAAEMLLQHLDAMTDDRGGQPEAAAR